MARAEVQKRIIKELRAAKRDLSLADLVARVLPHASSGRSDVKAAVVPLLYQGHVKLTPKRKFSIGS